MVAFLVAGCTSDAGKSVVVAGLCRAFARRGIAVAPFKAQNMSNNSAVTADGGEIGRAQALQAYACGLEPDTRFNPILLKPGSDRRSQLVVHGKATGDVSARSYIHHRTELRQVAAQALAELEKDYDLVICEGAGSPAEINLRATDVANMGLAEAADLPVYLVGDIDRGGVLAHFFGTYHILDPQDQARIRGFIVNKFRGDTRILTPGLDELFQRTGVPTLAVLPFINGLWVDAEDSLQSTIGSSIGPSTPALGSQRIRVAAIRLPRVSNATDVEALACEPGVTVSWSVDPDYIAEADLVVIPGSKTTISDLAWLRSTGIAEALIHRAATHRPILGICGGFQMMCTTITDPVESGSTHPVRGLELFDADITFRPTKTLIRHPGGAYEVHHGQVTRNAEQPWIGAEGCTTNALFGTHRHGQLENDEFRRDFLSHIAKLSGKTGFVCSPNTSFSGERLRQLDLIADVIEKEWDLDQLLAEVGYTTTSTE
ncbi:cobyric acid synthase [Corynebacterium felinum]|uniref:Cobyric acid synthase n=1 Tax=Corynebacterium felinum TaxID=131318 RepID=A0ABU2BF19_9CORY|nr:cobyric acid synthase [Corynebacterium felinum]MDF5819888.1 cobyric acid synthase [Corynebacterium felinum]MDR7355969.1 adenosylcobyric acid synthase [Corynebacterium felinum]WJY95305.1 Cobyric acid synthase [Corynebacterium felinum]